MGIVWTTQIKHVRDIGRRLEGVAIPEPYNMATRRVVPLSMLNTGRKSENAKHYLDYLASDAALNIHAKYGFAKRLKS